MARELYLVYHDPGDPEGVNLINVIAEKVEKIAGIKVYTLRISEMERLGSPFNKDSKVYAILAFRGGHLSTTISKANASKACYIGKPPVELIARGISSLLKECKSILVIYRKAKRFVSEQNQDLELLAKYLSKLTGASVRISPAINSDDPEQCVIVTAFMPGRMSKNAIKEYAQRVKVPHLLPFITDHIVSDILERLTAECTDKPM